MCRSGRAAVEAVDQRAQLLVLEVLVAGRSNERAAAEGLGHDLLDLRPRHRAEESHEHSELGPGDRRAARPLLRVERQRRCQRPHQAAPTHQLAELRLDAAELGRSVRLECLGDQAADEVELDRQSCSRLQRVAVHEPGRGVEAGRLLDVAVDEHVLPGDERVVEDHDGVVLVEAGRQRVVPRRLGGQLVRAARDQLLAGCVHRRDEDERVVLGLPLLQMHGAVLGDEGRMREGRPGRQHLRAAYDHAAVALGDDVHEDVLDLVDRPVAVDRRVDQDVIQEQHLLCVASIPRLGTGLERCVEVGCRPERGHEGGLVVGRPPHEAVRQASPGRDRLARCEQLVGRVARHEEPVRRDSAAVDAQKHVALLWIVKHVVEACDRPGGVPKRGMLGDVLDPLAPDVDRSPVAEAFEVLLAGQCQRADGLAHRVTENVVPTAQP